MRLSGATAVLLRSFHTVETRLIRICIARLGVQRLRTLQEKKTAQAKAARRDIALLLEKGKVETARIKVENSE